jgi:N-acetyl-anhydromuramyl-L-alanine amidase AmpD
MTYGRITLVASLVTLGACGGGAKDATGPSTCTASLTLAAAPAPAVVPVASPYDSLFDAAGAEYGVPAGLLRAVSYVETRWQMVEGHEELPGQSPAFGVMALRGERLREGARLAGVGEEDVRRDARANVRAAAALLRRDADDLGVTTLDASAWALVVARASGIAHAEARASYVRDVDAVRGGRRALPDAPVAARAAADPCPPPKVDPVDQPGAAWRASPNFNDRMAGDGGRIHMVIIHSCEGAYAGCWSWLASTASGVSAHYVVREDGAEITQLVREQKRAWHIGAIYDSALNAGHDGRLHGVQSNHFTIGIEHGGYASQTQWPSAQIEASAKLVCDIAKRWQIPRDRLHIVAHGQLQPANRTDPGAGWPWADYMARIERHCS